MVESTRETTRVLMRPCRQCGDAFEPVHPQQRFCRPSCRRAHFNVREQLRLPLGDPEADLFREPFE